MTATINSLVRLIGLGICVYGIADHKLPQHLASEQAPSIICRSVYLTNIGLFLTFSTLFLGLLITIVSFAELETLHKKLNNIYIFVSAKNIGIETIVTIGFWLLYSINPSLVVNPKLYNTKYRDSFIKQLSMHFFPLCLALREGWIANPKNRFFNHIEFFVFAFFYYCFSKYVAATRGRWQYSVLTNSSESGRIMFFFIFMLLGQASIEIFILVRRRFEKGTKNKEKPYILPC